MGLHETLTNQDLQRGANAMLDFYATRGVLLNAEQKELVVRAFDHGISTLMEGPIPSDAPQLPI